MEKELIFNRTVRALYKGSNEWIKHGTEHAIRIDKPSNNKRYYMLKLYIMDISPIRMYSYFSEGELKKDWELL
jgi:hypothetical protein